MTPWFIIIIASIAAIAILLLIAWCISLHIHYEPAREREYQEGKSLEQYQSESYDAYKIAHYYWVRYDRLHKTKHEYEAHDYFSLLDLLEMTRNVCLDEGYFRDAYSGDVIDCINRGIPRIQSSREQYRKLSGKEPTFPDIDW